MLASLQVRLCPALCPRRLTTHSETPVTWEDKGKNERMGVPSRRLKDGKKGTRHLLPSPPCQVTVLAVAVFLLPQPWILGNCLSHIHRSHQAPLTPHPNLLAPFFPRGGNQELLDAANPLLTVHTASVNLQKCRFFSARGLNDI